MGFFCPYGKLARIDQKFTLYSESFSWPPLTEIFVLLFMDQFVFPKNANFSASCYFSASKLTFFFCFFWRFWSKNCVCCVRCLKGPSGKATSELRTHLSWSKTYIVKLYMWILRVPIPRGRRSASHPSIAAPLMISFDLPETLVTTSLTWKEVVLNHLK